MPRLRAGVVGLGVSLMFAVAAQAAPATVEPESIGLSQARLERVTQLMQGHIDAGTFAGSVTLIARRGRIAMLTAQGVIDLEARTPTRTDTLFRIMSMTKPVVAVSILMLVEEGKVRLTDTIGKYIPALERLTVAVPNTSGVFAAAPSGAVFAPQPWRTVDAERQITVRDLLTHTSGLASGGASNAYPVTIGAGETLAQVLPRLAGAPLDFQPGTHWAYSAQYGFDVLARVVEVAADMSFDRFVEQRIFAPLGMRDTFFYRAGSEARRATLYQSVDGKLQKQPDGPHMNGAYFSGGGGLTSTAEDYLKFASMLMNGGELDGTRLLGRRTVELMRSAFVLDTLPGRNLGESWGLGVRVISDPPARNTLLSQGSFGWSGAYNTHFFIDPEEQVIALFMTQVANLLARGEIRNDFETAVMQAIVDERD